MNSILQLCNSYNLKTNYFGDLSIAYVISNQIKFPVGILPSNRILIFSQKLFGGTKGPTWV